MNPHRSSPRASLLAAWLALGLVYLAAATAGFLAPNSPWQQFRDLPHAPPSAWRWEVGDGGLQLLVKPQEQQRRTNTANADGDLERVEKTAVDAGPGFETDQDDAVAARWLATAPPAGFEPEGRLFLATGTDLRLLTLPPESGPLLWLGSDALGRDLFSRLLFGARVSLLSGLLAGLLAVALGTLIGMVAGLGGALTAPRDIGSASRPLDRALGALADMALALPWLFLLLALRAALPLQATPEVSFAMLVLVLGFAGWPPMALLARGITRELTTLSHFEAARGLGLPPHRLLLHYALPAVLPTAATQLTVLIPRFVLAEVTLSFLGLGMPESVPSWGHLLAQAHGSGNLLAHPWLLTPALTLTVVILSYHRVANSLRGEAIAAYSPS